MFVASVSMSNYETCLVDSVDCLLMVYSTIIHRMLTSTILPSPLLQHSPRSVLCLGVGSTCFPISWEMTHLWWQLGQAPIYDYRKISLGIIFLAFLVWFLFSLILVLVLVLVLVCMEESCFVLLWDSVSVSYTIHEVLGMGFLSWNGSPFGL